MLETKDVSKVNRLVGQMETEQLRALNSIVVDRLNYLRRVKNMEAVFSFQVGDVVRTADDLRPRLYANLEAKVKSIRRTKVSIEILEGIAKGQVFTIGAGALRHFPKSKSKKKVGA